MRTILLLLACLIPVLGSAQKKKVLAEPEIPILTVINPDTIFLNVLGRDTSACLKDFPTHYYYKYTESNRWQGYETSYLSYRGSYCVTQCYSSDSVLVCQKAKVHSKLVSVISLHDKGLIVPDGYLNCGNGKVRDYNASFLFGGWSKKATERIWSVTDYWYVNGEKVKSVDLDLQGKDTVEVVEYGDYPNHSAERYIRYFYKGKEVLKANYYGTKLTDFSFTETNSCGRKNIIYDSIQQVYKRDGKICNGKINVFYTGSEAFGLIDQEVFFTNGKVDSLITFIGMIDSEIRPCLQINYHNNSEINFYYNGSGTVESMQSFSFPSLTEKEKLTIYSKDRYQHGISISYNGSNEKKQDVSYYKKGVPTGTWLYYNFDEVVYKKVTFNRKGKIVKTEMLGPEPQYTY